MPAFLFQLFSSGPHGGGPVLSWRQKMNTGTQNAAQQNVARILLILGQRRVHAPQEQFAGDAKMRGGRSGLDDLIGLHFVGIEQYVGAFGHCSGKYEFQLTHLVSSRAEGSQIFPFNP